MKRNCLFLAGLAAVPGCTVTVPDVPRAPAPVRRVEAPPPAPPPAPTPAPVTTPPPPYDAMVQRSSFDAKTSVKLQAGYYSGNFSLSGSSAAIEGVSKDKTILGGDLIINSDFTTVKNLTVLGRIVIKGSQNKIVDVDYRGGVDDRGQLNKY